MEAGADPATSEALSPALVHVMLIALANLEEGVAADAAKQQAERQVTAVVSAAEASKRAAKHGTHAARPERTQAGGLRKVRK